MTVHFYCLFEGEYKSQAFKPKGISLSNEVDDLKRAIQKRIPKDRYKPEARYLILRHVSIPDGKDESPIMLSDVVIEMELKDPMKQLGALFPEDPDRAILILVCLPVPAQKKKKEKRNRDDDEERSAKKVRSSSSTIKRAIATAGFTEKVVAKGTYDISLLSSEERVRLLDALGQDVGKTETFISLFNTAIQLRHISANIEEMDRISAPGDARFPVIDSKDLYIRKSYQVLYKEILGHYERTDPHDPSARNQVIVTGTSGIGKSAFLLYFAIRLLVESAEDNPPIIIFHTKQKKTCFAFGGCSTLRFGSIEEFMPFLILPDTWYFVDSSKDPELSVAKTIISASPKTLSSGEYWIQAI
ncbi:hypothetical protein EMPS_04132 [Entomortierella parvispora]|uniref:Crinkler effector protein N-terminal domain-containing protein n=1 Tax=Entomortierella parvispora TaxID=205924 RepID=A0A9P3H7Z4_9FUNG|nr:hypothetical protein EMPS_04132 [Entomortierella parvispora]